MEKGKEAGKEGSEVRMRHTRGVQHEGTEPNERSLPLLFSPSYSPCCLAHTFARLPSHLYSLRLPCWLGVLQSLAEAELEADLSQRRKRGKAAARRIYSTSSKKSEADEQQRASFVRSLLRNPI